MSGIPHKFHFVFGLKPQTEPFHLIHFLCLESCRQTQQPDEIHFYYHYEPWGTYWERIKPDLILHRVDLESFVTESSKYFETAEGSLIKMLGLEYAHQSDFIRLRILLEQGGVYADMDTIFVNALPDALFDKSFVLGEECPTIETPTAASQQSLCNALILSAPDAAFGRAWLAAMHESFDGTWSRHSCQAATELQRKMPEDVFVVPQHYFYKHSWTREGLATLLEGLDTDFRGVYSMHLWAHLWWDAERTDFSFFHGGLVTESWLRNVDTTLGIVARRYL